MVHNTNRIYAEISYSHKSKWQRISVFANEDILDAHLFSVCWFWVEYFLFGIFFIHFWCQKRSIILDYLFNLCKALSQVYNIDWHLPGEFRSVLMFWWLCWVGTQIDWNFFVETEYLKAMRFSSVPAKTFSETRRLP